MSSVKLKFSSAWAVLAMFLLSGCAAIFGWNIHAPAALSNNFPFQVKPIEQRVALYLEPETLQYESTNKGSWSADPQRYFIGEAFGPMIIEAFQNAFDEFMMMEAAPTPEILKHYGVPYLVVVRIKAFDNVVTWKGQAVKLTTETVVFDQNMQALDHFESSGSSDADKIFSKKGGPEVNLNAAIENNLISMAQYLQDSMRSGVWNNAS